jgi:hypothetical protein
MTTKQAAAYKSVEDKISELEAQKASDTELINTLPEDQKAPVQERINEADRKIRWYNGRKNSAKFQAKAEAAKTVATTEPVADVVPTEVQEVADPTPAASVVNES